MHAMAAISGVGAAKLEKYGKLFLDTINSGSGKTHENSNARENVLMALKAGISGLESLASQSAMSTDKLVTELTNLVKSGELSVRNGLSSIDAQIDEDQLGEIEGEILVLLEEGNFSLQQVHQEFHGRYSIEELRLVKASVENELAEGEGV